MTTHTVVSQKEWIEARKELLTKEKEFTRLHDQLSAERRRLPFLQYQEQVMKRSKQYGLELQMGYHHWIMISMKKVA